MYLYDTCIVSEFRKSKPNAGVITFCQTVDAESAPVYLSVLTLGEIQKGIDVLKLRNDLIQAERIAQWFESELKPAFSNILLFDETCAYVWGKLLARDPSNPIDKQLAATALVYDLTLVTRNVKHVKDTGVTYLNPFT